MNSYLCIHCNTITPDEKDEGQVSCENCPDKTAWRMRCACGAYRVGNRCSNCPLIW